MKMLEQKFQVVCKELSNSFTATEILDIQILIDAGELGVAFENFCTQLDERDVICSLDQINRLAAIGTAMGIRPIYWENLMP
jgi:hypothetical protein